MKVLVTSPKDIPFLRLLLRSPVAMILALPLSFLLGVDMGFFAGLGEAGGIVMGITRVAGWILITLYLTWSSSVRIIWGKSCIAYAIIAFLLPIASIVLSIIFGGQAVSQSESGLEQAGAVIGAGIAGILLLIISFTFGLFTGFIGLTLGYFALRPAR